MVQLDRPLDFAAVTDLAEVEAFTTPGSAAYDTPVCTAAPPVCAELPTTIQERAWTSPIWY